MKERELERAEVTKAANLVNTVEKRLGALQLEYEQVTDQCKKDSLDLPLHP